MKKLKIGLAGLGTVGHGVYQILKKDAKILELKSQTIFEIVAVSARSNKDFVDSKIKFYSNAIDLANDPQVDVVIEVIGGTTLAKELVETAIKNGKKVITANKALLAEFGSEISALVEKYNCHIGFEASTAGANPVIKTFKESFTSSEISEFYAILNGTCNFILTKMGNEGSNYLETLAEAQKLGYAEADPTLDIKGIDSAHKLAILSAISASSKPAFEKLHIEGVDEISIQDVKLVDELGYKIKLLGIYKKLGDACQQTIYPALVKKSDKIAQVDGPFNAVLVNTSNASWNLSIGRGAGGLTTGSAVVADLIDIACGRSSYLFGVENSKLSKANVINISQRVGKYFLKLVIDKNSAQKTNIAEAIFGNKILVEQAVFIDANEEIICGFLTNSQVEKDVLEILKILILDWLNLQNFYELRRLGFKPIDPETSSG